MIHMYVDLSIRFCHKISITGNNLGIAGIEKIFLYNFFILLIVSQTDNTCMLT